MDKAFPVGEHVLVGLEAPDELLELLEHRVAARRLLVRMLAAVSGAPRVRLVAVVHRSLVPP